MYCAALNILTNRHFGKKKKNSQPFSVKSICFRVLVFEPVRWTLFLLLSGALFFWKVKTGVHFNFAMRVGQHGVQIMVVVNDVEQYEYLTVGTFALLGLT